MPNSSRLLAGLSAALLCLSSPCVRAAGTDAVVAFAPTGETRSFEVLGLTHTSPAPPHAAPALHAEPRRQGALYRITRDGQISYLFGTVHVGTEAFYPLAPGVSQALAAANQLVVELDTRADEAFQHALKTYGSYRDGDKVARHVSPETLACLTAALHASGIPLSTVAHLKPWLLANLLTGLELERSGFQRRLGLETFLLADAQARGTTVAELESADYQLSLFDTLNDADAERYLRESLAELSDGSALRKAKSVIDAWESGNATALDALVADATSGKTVNSDFTRRTLLGRRNPEMATRIESIMQQGKTSFVGVGLLHMLGANGLPQLLAQRGYQVERMD